MTKTNTLSLSAVVAAMILAALLLLMIVDIRPVEAAFMGTNGRIFYEHNGSVWSINPDGTAPTELVGNDDNNYELDPAISPDGTKVAYIYDETIWVMHSDGTNPRQLTDGGAEQQESDFDPAWSPDGKKIVFARIEPGSSHADLWVMNADGSGQTNLTNTPGNWEDSPAWSPDGLEIAYYRGGCEEPDDYGSCIYKMFANGLGVTNLTKPEEEISCDEGGGVSFHIFSDSPDWSPDSSKIAFESDGDCGAPHSQSIWVMNRDGSEKKDLIQLANSGNYEPTFSPDGQKIAFSSNRDDSRGDIYLIDANGEEAQSGLRRLTNSEGFDEDPDWGPPLRAVSIPTLAFTEATRTGPPGCGYSTNPGQPLQFLSVDEHGFFDADGKPDATPDGNTHIYGTITVRGSPGDALQSLELEIVKGQDVIRAGLAGAARTALIKPFPSTGVLQIAQRQLLFKLSSAQAAQFDTTTNTVLTLRVKATTQRGGTTTKTHSYKDPKTGQATTGVQQLVLYDGANRYGARNENEGGDGWVLPSLEPAAADLGPVNPGTVWGDFSSMNGGAICPHRTHQKGYDVDGDAVGPNAWYDARNAATANNILDMLRHPIYGTRIDKVFVTYNRPGGTLLRCENGNTDSNHSAFYTAIQNETVPAPGGGTRSATSVIRPVAQHCVHFHIQFFPT
jgi:Tol biopolymer transport system component